MKYNKQKNISVALQFYNLKYEYPDMNIRLHRNKMQCWFNVSPTPLSKIYNIYMIYTGTGRPKVILYDNNLLKIDQPDFPHCYDKNIEDNKVELCLYYGREWNRRKLISETIIPWTVEWLAHYEIWLVTGKWNGGGKHPSTENRKGKRRNMYIELMMNAK